LIYNSTSSVLQKAILGKFYYKSTERIRRTSLFVGVLSIIVVFCCVFLMFFNTLIGIYYNIIFYLPLLVISFLNILINRKGYFQVSKHILISSCFIVVFLASTWGRIESGIILLYFPLLVWVFVVFEYRQFFSKLLYLIFAFVSMFVVLYTNWSLIPKFDFSADVLKVKLFVNFCFSVFGTAFSIQFLASMNKQSQDKVLAKELNLRQLTWRLSESQKLLELAIKASNTGIWQWNFKNNCVITSKKWRAILGYQDEGFEEIPFNKYLLLVHPKERIEVEEAIQSHIKDGSPYYIEFRVQNSKKEYTWVNDTGIVDKDKMGVPIRMVGSILDITSRKRAESIILEQNALLKKTNEELDNFVYRASHDIRAPLMSVLGLINVIRIEQDLESIERYAQLMKRSILHLDEFISDITDYSRNSRTKIKLEYINLDELVDNALKSLEYLGFKKDMKIVKEYDKEDSLISDIYRLAIILKNVISNAIKYRKRDVQGSFVKISFEKGDGYCMINIQDNGHGIKKEVAPYVFNMFFRGIETSMGSGLGLYITKEMVYKLEGQITFKSEEGKGTLFCIFLPQ